MFRTALVAIARNMTGDLTAPTFYAHGTAAEVAAKWASRLGQATQEMQAGVQRVSTSPGAAAAAKKQKWVARMTDTATQDKWARNVGAVSLQEWQQRMVDVGISRVSSGAQAAIPKVENTFTSLLQHIDAGVSRVRSMPDLTPTDREQRAIAMMRWNAQYKKPV